MSSENEKLRALLAEARRWIVTPSTHDDDLYKAIEFKKRIDAALAEPVAGCAECARWEEYDEQFQRTVNDVVQRERDEARAEVARLKAELDEKSGYLVAVEKLIPYEDYISDKTCAENVEGVLRRAYQRGAEAMREAAARASETVARECRAALARPEDSMTAHGADECARVVRALPIPEDK